MFLQLCSRTVESWGDGGYGQGSERAVKCSCACAAAVAFAVCKHRRLAGDNRRFDAGDGSGSPAVFALMPRQRLSAQMGKKDKHHTLGFLRLTRRVHCVML